MLDVTVHSLSDARRAVGVKGKTTVLASRALCFCNSRCKGGSNADCRTEPGEDISHQELPTGIDFILSGFLEILNKTRLELCYE